MEVRKAEDKGYSIEMQVVSVEPSGLSPDRSNKARLLLVSIGRGVVVCVSVCVCVCVVTRVSDQTTRIQVTPGKPPGCSW